MTDSSEAVVAREAERATLWRLLETAAAVLASLSLVMFITNALRVIAGVGLSDRDAVVVILVSVAHPLSIVMALVAVILCVVLRLFAPMMPVSGRVRLTAAISTVVAGAVGIAGAVLTAEALGGGAGDDITSVVALALQGAAALAASCVTVWLTTLLKLPATDDLLTSEVPSP